MATPAVSDDVLETSDIQGLVLRSYRDFTARFLLLRVEEAQKARTYLQQLATRINPAKERPETFALQIAFTGDGMEALGVERRIVQTFSRELTEGMNQKDRSDALGDRNANDPSKWDWGHQEPVHAMLMVYAIEALLETHVASERSAMAGGFSIVREKHSTILDKHKEHFGWRDGLSMPAIAGVPDDPERPKDPAKKKREWWTDPIPPGEFVLGYRNDYKVYTDSPSVDLGDDLANQLPFTPDGLKKNLGKNGTYLVYREMTQDVHAYWRYLAEQSREPGASVNERAVALGAKMVGRWPAGAPLTTTPDRVDADRDDNAFLYNKDRTTGGDFIGVNCPRGAHIRRASPRDVLALEDRDADTSLSMVRKHQMVRRGRAFGDPVSPKLVPEEMIAAQPDGKPRGLHFICLVSDINRQFEFVQRAWIHSGTFDSMYKDGDPISGNRAAPGSENPNAEFTCPASPVRRRYKEMPQFTTLVGGAYFFLPGLAALRFIAKHPAPGGAPL